MVTPMHRCVVRCSTAYTPCPTLVSVPPDSSLPPGLYGHVMSGSEPTQILRSKTYLNPYHLLCTTKCSVWHYLHRPVRTTHPLEWLHLSLDDNGQIHPLDRSLPPHGRDSGSNLARIRFGTPATITTDRGSQFQSGLWSDLMSVLSTQRLRTTAYDSQANRLIEKFHRQLKGALKCHTPQDLGITGTKSRCLACRGEWWSWWACREKVRGVDSMWARENVSLPRNAWSALLTDTLPRAPCQRSCTWSRPTVTSWRSMRLVTCSTTPTAWSEVSAAMQVNWLALSIPLISAEWLA